MKYNTEQAVEKALTCTKLLTFGNSFVDMSHDELADFANLIRKETLLEAAELLETYAAPNNAFNLLAFVLRRMAEE